MSNLFRKYQSSSAIEVVPQWANIMLLMLWEHPGRSSGTEGGWVQGEGSLSAFWTVEIWISEHLQVTNNVQVCTGSREREDKVYLDLCHTCREPFTTKAGPTKERKKSPK